MLIGQFAKDFFCSFIVGVVFRLIISKLWPCQRIEGYINTGILFGALYVGGKIICVMLWG